MWCSAQGVRGQPPPELPGSPWPSGNIGNFPGWQPPLMTPAAAPRPRALGQPPPHCRGSPGRGRADGACRDTRAPPDATGLWSRHCRAGHLEREEGAVGLDPVAAWPSWGAAKGCWAPVHPPSRGWALVPQPPQSPRRGLRGETPRGWAGACGAMLARGDVGASQPCPRHGA